MVYRVYRLARQDKAPLSIETSKSPSSYEDLAYAVGSQRARRSRTGGRWWTIRFGGWKRWIYRTRPGGMIHSVAVCNCGTGPNGTEIQANGWSRARFEDNENTQRVKRHTYPRFHPASKRMHERRWRRIGFFVLFFSPLPSLCKVFHSPLFNIPRLQHQLRKACMALRVATD